MAGKTVVFYSPKEVAELRKLNRAYKKGTIPDIKKAIADWAAAHNRAVGGVWNKFYICGKKNTRRKTSRRKSIVVRAPRVKAPTIQVQHTAAHQLRVPITSIEFEPGYMVINYQLNS